MGKRVIALLCALCVTASLSGCADVDKDKILNTIESVGNDLQIDTKGITDALRQIDTTNLENSEVVQKAKEILNSIDTGTITQLTTELQNGITAVSAELEDASATYKDAQSKTFEDTEAYNYIIFEYEPLAWGIDAFNVTEDQASVLTVVGKEGKTYYSTLNTDGVVERGYTTEDGLNYKKDFITKKETRVEKPKAAKVLTYVFDNVRKWEYKPVVLSEFLKKYTEFSVNTFMCDSYVVNLLWNKEQQLELVIVTDTVDRNTSYTYSIRNLMSVEDVDNYVAKNG